MTDKEKYETICFSIKEKQHELEKLRTDLFIFNPHIAELISEIVILEKEKKELEDKIND